MRHARQAAGAVGIAVWNTLAVHGLFRIQDGVELRELALAVAIALVVSALVIRWWSARSKPPRLH